MESITLTLSGTSSILEAQYFPPIELTPGKNYSLGLVQLLTFNSIPNIDVGYNKFYIGGQEIELPVGCYEIGDIEKYIVEFLKKRKIKTNLFIKPNNNTLRCEIISTADIDFRPKDSIAKILGFDHKLLPAAFHHVCCSDHRSHSITHRRSRRKFSELSRRSHYFSFAYKIFIMGIVYNSKGFHSQTEGYKRNVSCGSSISRQRTRKALTRQNIQFLKSLGLKTVSGGK